MTFYDSVIYFFEGLRCKLFHQRHWVWVNDEKPNHWYCTKCGTGWAP